MPLFRSSVRLVPLALAFSWIGAFCPRVFAESRVSQTTIICSKYFTNGEDGLSLEPRQSQRWTFSLGDEEAVVRAMAGETVPIVASDLAPYGHMRLTVGADRASRVIVDFHEPGAQDAALTMARVTGSLRALRERFPVSEPGMSSVRFNVAPIELARHQTQTPIASPLLRFVSDVIASDRRARDLFHQRLSQLETDALSANGFPVVLTSSAWRVGFGPRSHLNGQIGPTGDLFEISPSRVLVDLDTYEMTIVNAFVRPARGIRLTPREPTVGRQFSVEHGARN